MSATTAIQSVAIPMTAITRNAALASRGRSQGALLHRATALGLNLHLFNNFHDATLDLKLKVACYGGTYIELRR